jgi:hypothetical protein
VVTPNCFGFNFLHILSHHANIGCVIAALVAEAIKLETIVESRQRRDVLLEADVRTTSAAASSTSAPTAAMSTTTAMHATATMSAPGTMPPTGTVARNAIAATAGTHMTTTLMSWTGSVADVAFSFGCPTTMMLRTFAEIGFPL